MYVVAGATGHTSAITDAATVASTITRGEISKLSLARSVTSSAATIPAMNMLAFMLPPFYPRAAE